MLDGDCSEISKRERALSLFGPVPKTRSEPARPTTERTGSQVRSSPLVNSHFGVGTWHCHTSTRTRPTLTQTWNALLENLVDEFSSEGNFDGVDSPRRLYNRTSSKEKERVISGSASVPRNPFESETFVPSKSSDSIQPRNTLELRPLSQLTSAPPNFPCWEADPSFNPEAISKRTGSDLNLVRQLLVSNQLARAMACIQKRSYSSVDCAFCKINGREKEMYRSHSMTSPFTKEIICPFLAALYKCSGDNGRLDIQVSEDWWPYSKS